MLEAGPCPALVGPRYGRGGLLAGRGSRNLDHHPADADGRAGDGAGTKLVARRVARTLWAIAGGTGPALEPLGELDESPVGVGPRAPGFDSGASPPGRN